MGFFADDEARLGREFLDQGYLLAPAEDLMALARIRVFVAERAAGFLGLGAPDEAGPFLDGIAAYVDAGRLNALRLHVIDGLQSAAWFRAAYFSTGRRLIQAVVGNELAMQRGVGFSIQLPNDETSVLPLHSDVWSEDSPFEVVLWIPLVDCRRTKSMFILPREADARWRDRMHEFAGRSVEEFTRALEPELRYVEIDYGHVLLFTHTLMHGNRLNREPTARWSLNVRFKGLFTPYSDKQLGDFFDPITLRPATRVGMTYRLPDGFG